MYDKRLHASKRNTTGVTFQYARELWTIMSNAKTNLCVWLPPDSRRQLLHKRCHSLLLRKNASYPTSSVECHSSKFYWLRDSIASIMSFYNTGFIAHYFGLGLRGRFARWWFIDTMLLKSCLAPQNSVSFSILFILYMVEVFDSFASCCLDSDDCCT